MSSDKIRQWIQQKLENGVDKDRIKESLENTGHDPDLVEEVARSQGIGDDPFQQEDQVDEENTSDTSSGDMDLEFDTDRSESSGEEDKSSSGYNLDFSVPSISFSRKDMMVFGLSLLIAVGMAGVFAFYETSSILEPQCSGDSGAGVKVYSFEAREGITTAEVRVVEDVSVVLEVFESGEKIDQKVKEMNGRGTISVNSVGDSISFHEYGCDDPSVERSY